MFSKTDWGKNENYAVDMYLYCWITLTFLSE